MFVTKLKILPSGISLKSLINSDIQMLSEKLIYNILLIVIYGISIIVFAALFFIPAPYGKFTRKGWGVRINPKIAWIVMEFPAVFVMLLCFFTGDRKANIVAIVFLLIWMLHYIQRTFIYPFLMKSKKNNFPILIILFSVLFNILNGYLNGRYLFYFSSAYDRVWLREPRFITGAVIFFAGYVINIYSDHLLRNLRRHGENGYSIPHGGLFKFISSPNYFGEIMEWIGWALLTWSLAGAAFAVFTAANLVPRAVSNHKWYLKNFPDYPKKRKALIPFVY